MSDAAPPEVPRKFFDAKPSLINSPVEVPPERRGQFDAFIQGLNETAQSRFQQMLEQQPELRQSLEKITKAVMEQAEKGLTLMDEWDKSGLLGKMKLTPSLLKAGIISALGVATTDAVMNDLRVRAKEVAASETSFSPDEIKSFIDALDRVELRGHLLSITPSGGQSPNK